jgi:glycosyltransferase involved in cell wall biosynthesis
LKIIIVSNLWPSYDKSGLSLAASQHTDILINEGHEVHIFGSSKEIYKENHPKNLITYIPSSGRGSIFSRAKVDECLIRDRFSNISPDLIILEAWQTALTDISLNIAASMGFRILMVSHGVSLHPFKPSLFYWLRSLMWLPYKLKLKKRIQKIQILAVLDKNSLSDRFYDRKLARLLNVPVIELRNAPFNINAAHKKRTQRKNQIILVGYFSYIKNQLEAINVFKDISLDIDLILIGNKSGKYYEACVNRVKILNLSSKIRFLDDTECNISEMIASSLAVLSTSLTEVLPMNLIEAMALKTPFIASNVGAIKSLNAGILVYNRSEIKLAIYKLYRGISYWQKISDEGFNSYNEKFNINHVKINLIKAVSISQIGS